MYKKQSLDSIVSAIEDTAGLGVPAHDSVTLSYNHTTKLLETVVYSLNGSTLSTVTLSYDNDNNLTSVSRTDAT